MGRDKTLYPMSSELQKVLGGAASDVDLRELLRETEEHILVVIEQLEKEASQRPDRRLECDELVARMNQQLSRWRRATNVALDADNMEREEQEVRRRYTAGIEAQVATFKTKLENTLQDLNDVRLKNAGIQKEIDRLEKRAEETAKRER